MEKNWKEGLEARAQQAQDNAGAERHYPEFSDYNNEITREEAEALYDSLPEGMKTGHYGLTPEGDVFSSEQEAGANALPHVIVTFANGEKISLHLTRESSLSFEQQVEKIKHASTGDSHIKDVGLVWQR